MFQKTQFTTSEILTAVANIPIQDSLSLRAWLHPDKKLFTFLDDEGKESDTLTYLQLWQRAVAVADVLKTCSDHGDRILLFYPQGLDFIVAFFGCLLANRIAVPLSLPNRRRVDKCVNVMTDCGARIAMAPHRTYEQLAAGFKETTAADTQWLIAEEIKPSLKLPEINTFRSLTNQDEVAFLQYTSGSTSTPKGVMVTHRNIFINLHMMRDSWSLDANSDMVFWQPHHHDMGLIMGQLLPILLGNHTVIMSPNTAVRQPSIWLQAISRYRAVLSGGPNFIYDLAVARYSETDMDGLDLSSWKIAPNGADVVRLKTLERFYATYKQYGFKMETFMPCYGLAEATLFVTGGPTRQLPKYMEVDKDELEVHRKVKSVTSQLDSRSLVGCGEPNWELEVAIANPETCKECAPSEIGEIWIHGRSVTAGYWHNEEVTQKTFHAKLQQGADKNFLRTGDIGFIGTDGHIYICGRLKDLIICEGRNLHPEDIEYTILQSTDRLKSQSCAVFSYENDEQRQAIVAVIETDRDLMRRLESEAKILRGLIGQSITETHGIGLSKIVFIPPATLKKTTSGKVQRSLMKSLYLNGELEVL